MQMNKVIVAGNLTKNPELRYTPSGSPVCEMTIAVNRKSNNRDEVCYLDVVAWGKSGENCNTYLSKGSSAMVEGYLKQENWMAQDGSRRSKIKLVVENIQFLSSPAKHSRNEEPTRSDNNRYSDDYKPEPPPTPPEPQPRFYGDTNSQNGTPPPPPPAEPDAEDDIPF